MTTKNQNHENKMDPAESVRFYWQMPNRVLNALAWMQQWNRIFIPLEYGYGLMRYKLPRIFSPFSPVPEFIGHSGASGSFAFYCPKGDYYLSGTVKQLEARSTSFRMMPILRIS